MGWLGQRGLEFPVVAFLSNARDCLIPGDGTMQRSKLLKLTIANVGCVGPNPLEVRLDNVLCLVGPNNSGKTTVLRAYELAFQPGLFSPATDRCNWSPPEAVSEIILDVHIPEGMGNVDPIWKEADGDYLVVRSRWQWPLNGPAVRQTWDPIRSLWAEDGKAGGADNVFKSRLPKPMRIKSLDDAGATEAVLLTLALTPFLAELKAVEGDPNSKLATAKRDLATIVNDLTKPHEKRIGDLSDQIQKGFQGVFPTLGVRVHVEMPDPELRLEALLKSGSGIRVAEPAGLTSVGQQGTGARRALFWSMLQVHNELTRLEETRALAIKDATTKLKAETKKAAPRPEIVAGLEKTLADLVDGGELPGDDLALPGYILLIDEPENALHPMAARAAQKHLYALADHPDWQVLMTTHSPYFVNPLADHTTIARLQRSDDGRSISPRLYVADQASFSPEEKEDLQALQLMDIGFSEVFFGSYPILVEGDTEHAAFVASVVEPGDVMADQVTVIRARGKGILPALIKMLRHFGASFGIVHDADWPFAKDGVKASAMWGVNRSIRLEIERCRTEGLTIRHRCSIPDFERFLGGSELGKDKPLAAYRAISASPDLRLVVRDLFESLYTGDVHDPDCHVLGTALDESLRSSLIAWAGEHGQALDRRLGPTS